MAVIAAAALPIVFLFGRLEQLEADAPIAAQSGEIPTSLWFDGETLIAVRESPGMDLAIQRWPANLPRPLPWQTISLQKFTPKYLSRLGHEERHAIHLAMVRSNIPVQARAYRVVPKAESSDGSMVAWSVRDTVYLLPAIGGPPSSPAPIRLNGTVIDLAWIGDSLLAVAFDDGRYELHDTKAKSRVWTTDVPETSSMEVFGPFLAISDQQSVTVLDLRMGPIPRVSKYPLPPHTIKVAVSRNGRLATALSDGTVVLGTATDGLGGPFTLRAPGAVSEMAFYDEKRLLVGGDFRGIHLISAHAPPVEVFGPAVGTRLIAAIPARMAFTTADSFQVIPLRKRMVLSTFGRGTLYLAGGAFVIVAALAALSARRAAVPPATSPFLQARRLSDEITTPPLNLPAPLPPADLVAACVAGDCVLYAGAGLSAQAKLPTWDPLIHGLLDWTVSHDAVSPDYAASLTAALDQGQTNTVADALVNALRPRQELLQEYLNNVFVPPRRPTLSNLPASHRLLRKIGFGAAITDVYDSLLERAFDIPNVFTPADAENLLSALTRRQFFMLKLFGSLDRPDTVMVSPAEYTQLLSQNLLYSQFIDNLFFSRTHLFLGASLEGIESYLAGISSLGTVSRRHFALVGVTGAAWMTRAAVLERRYGVQVIPYAALDDHPDFLAFVTALAEEVEQKRPTTEQVTPAISPLSRVRLENVGPFEKLEIRLDRSWTVLLGDNGVGKSNILKAIAIGIVGKDAEPYAARIIKSGRTNATITLETERSSYVTHLLKKDDRAEVVTKTARPLEAEGWLVLGFPPLRTVSWQRRLTDLEGRSRPVSSDVVPLISSDPDPRLDRLKSWLVDIYLRNVDLERRGDKRYTRLLDDFFHVINEVTPGLTIALNDVNSSSKEVTVKTDDGVIPIESVSQGTTSLIGWVGILLQRMYEIHGDSENPRESYALVLIDEIDAHMHPGWQQSVAPILKKIFPNVQFVASTHSPLIVSELRRDQVLVLNRDVETHAVKVQPAEEEFSGMRADQILTSSMFGLQTTRNTETEDEIAEYSRLLGKREKTAADERRAKELRDRLNSKLKSGSTPAERQVEDAVKTALANQMGVPPPSKTLPGQESLPLELRLEIKQQLAELLAKKEPGS